MPRRVLQALAAILAAGMSPVAAQHAETTVTLSPGGGPDLTLSVWMPEDPVGVIAFSHGAGASPDSYDAFFDAYAAAGWAVVAPLHVDSRAHPEQANFTLQSAYFVRLRDIQAAAGWAEAAHADLPLVAMGHSYGSAIAATLVGGLVDRGGTDDQDAEAVVMLSSPGRIPGLISEAAYTGITVPLLMVTGTSDVVPGLAEDWVDHLYPFETTGSEDAFVLIEEGGMHSFGRYGEETDPEQADRAVETILAFLGAFVVPGEGDFSGFDAGDGAELRGR